MVLDDASADHLFNNATNDLLRDHIREHVRRVTNDILRRTSARLLSRTMARIQKRITARIEKRAKRRERDDPISDKERELLRLVTRLRSQISRDADLRTSRPEDFEEVFEAAESCGEFDPHVVGGVMSPVPSESPSPSAPTTRRRGEEEEPRSDRRDVRPPRR